MEYALNDFQDAGQALGNWDNHSRRAIERLLRKLLQYPKRPALIMLGAFPHRYYDPGCVLKIPHPGSTGKQPERPAFMVLCVVVRRGMHQLRAYGPELCSERGSQW